MFLDVADLDADGRNDVIAATHAGGILTFRGLDDQGVVWERHEIDKPAGSGLVGKGVAVGDVDGDGKPDIVYSCESSEGRSGIVWLSAAGSPWSGTWTRHELSGTEGTKFDQVLLRDLDGDGDPDVVTCEEVENLGVIWYENPTNLPSENR
jgi:hypothetical protein